MEQRKVNIWKNHLFSESWERYGQDKEMGMINNQLVMVSLGKTVTEVRNSMDVFKKI